VGSDQRTSVEKDLDSERIISRMSSSTRKRQQQVESNLKVGDTVLTQSGMVGKILVK